MKRHCLSLPFLMLALVISRPCTAQQESRVITTEIDALSAYQDGFAYDVMKGDDGAAVTLNDMLLIEDDGPGAGNSEKGTWKEELHQGILVRKTLQLDDARAFDAHLVLYMYPLDPDRKNQMPFFVYFNGERIEGPPLSWHENMWHWVPIPVEYLKTGENTVVVGCDAPKGKGYDLMIARADEYEAGGGTYITEGNTALISAGQVDFSTDEQSGAMRLISIGKNSAKSVDGGKTWITMKLGSTDDVVGEYSIRLNLERYKPEGSLLSQPVDLWNGIDGMETIKPECTVSDLVLLCLGDTPDGTSITWQLRSADTPDMMSDEWGEFRTVGSGPGISVRIDSGIRRYLQWKAVLTTDNPLKTPGVYSVSVKRKLTFARPENRCFVLDCENVRHRYPSVRFSYEKWDEPRLAELRKRLDLDSVIAGAVSDWDIINRVRHHVSQQWHHASPLPGYPEWNALDILDRRDRVGAGGMCIQFSIVFIQSLASLGYQARHINMFAHETVEVYVDELGKWVHVDPESVFDSYEYETTTGMPVNCLEQHRYFLVENGLGPERPIDWQATEQWASWGARGPFNATPVPLDFSTYTGWINNPERPQYPPQHRLAGFMRMMPRNDYFSNPYPRPLSQGSSNWPWNGYLNWYDEATPRKLQYSMHTDRECDFYPTLNRVEFDAVYGSNEGDIVINMTTFAPNFDGFEINVDGTGWVDSDARFIWTLKPSALNTLDMRVKNTLGPKGKPSHLQVMYHYKEPYSPRPEDW